MDDVEICAAGITCFVCQRMAKKRLDIKGGVATTRCLLCNRTYCDVHKGEAEGVCEINHYTYFKNHFGFQDVYESLEARERTLKIGSHAKGMDNNSNTLPILTQQ